MLILDERYVLSIVFIENQKLQKSEKLPKGSFNLFAAVEHRRGLPYDCLVPVYLDVVTF
jgi:hypothetical protein